MNSALDTAEFVMESRGHLRRGQALIDIPSVYFTADTAVVRIENRSVNMLVFLWMANAYIVTETYPACPSVATPQSFALLRVPVAFDVPILQMTMQQLMKTAQDLMWVFDGDVFSDMERDAEWFQEMEQCLELVRRRAYFLATTVLSEKDHDVLEYVTASAPTNDIIIGDCDSDNETEDIDVGALLERENKTRTVANEAWAWDMGYITSHMDVSLMALKCLVRMPVSVEVGTTLRPLIRERNKDTNFWNGLKKFRKTFECNLMCNRADRRIDRRKAPMRPRPTARQVLASKNPNLVHEDRFPGTYIELTRKRPITERAMYRLNYDALLCFHAKQFFKDAEMYPMGVVEMLILDDWESFPKLNGPRIIRIKCLRRWGVVFAWPDVYETASLCEAYVFLKEELARRNMPLELSIAASNPALPSKRRKLE